MKTLAAPAATITPTYTEVATAARRADAARRAYNAICTTNARTAEDRTRHDAAFRAYQSAAADHGALQSARHEAMVNLADQVTPEHNLGKAFDRAVRTALSHNATTENIVRQDAWTDAIVVRVDLPNGTHRFAVYGEDSFEAPTETPLLPWGRPDGTPVARVSMDAVVTLI